MPIPLDKHGQPFNLDSNYSRRMTRALHELLGLLRGIVADNYVSEVEAETLAKWVVTNREVANEWPVHVLVDRLERIYEDGDADEEERADLEALASEIVGQQDGGSFQFGPTDLPLTKPVPEVIFDLNEFVLTGRFLHGSRKYCKAQIEARGGRCSDSIRLQTNYLVIGALSSRDWRFSSFGNKILKAVEYSKRCDLAIISEAHWETYLGGSSRGAGA